MIDLHAPYGTRPYRIPLASMILLAVMALLLGGDAFASDMFRLREPGETLPKFELFDLNGKKHSLDPAALKKPTILFFWSVYCPVCKEAIPGMLELFKDWKEQGVDVWAINVDGDRFSNAVVSFSKDMSSDFKVLYDRLEGEYLVAADPLGVSKTPTLYLSNAKGKIVLRQVIEVDYKEVATTLESLFNDPIIH